MALTDQEVESLRFHLGYGNIGIGGYPYTPDGFKELFDQVIAPNLTGTIETTATTAITAGSTTAITPVSMTGIVVNARLVVDVGDAAEIVTVRSISGGTFTARFANEHPSSGYPIALQGGVARLRMLLHQADKAWQTIQDVSDQSTAGQLKKVDEVEWYEGRSGSVLGGRSDQYRAIVESISSLVRVKPAWADECSTQLEAY